ncbi:MAG TPA: glycosyltransferase family 87 protein, partial [Streptosporangiaceae bacterium]|nr:glycosyltransferase family 87 protein [Streptosporangiaceae bacterium]
MLVLAQRRDWRPSLRTSLFVGLAFRLTVLVLVALLFGERYAPYDLANDFHRAGVDVLAHRDPIIYARSIGWNYLPTYAFVLAVPAWVSQHLAVPWVDVARIPAILFDLGVIRQVGRVADEIDGRGRLRAFQWACNPLAILICADHGQMEPACLFFSLGAFVRVLSVRSAADRDVGTWRTLALAGAGIGVAISIKTWPVIFVPALLIGLPTWRMRSYLSAGAVAVLGAVYLTMPLTVGTPLHDMPSDARHILAYKSSVVGYRWGWSGTVFQWFAHLPATAPWNDPLVLSMASVGSKITLAGMLAAIWCWRRRHPVDIGIATALVFLILTPALGAQYLDWPMALMVARWARWTMPVQIAVSVYAICAYIPMNVQWLPGNTLTSHSFWHWAAESMVAASLVLIALFAIALPWRADRSEHPPAEPSSARVRDLLASELAPPTGPPTR